MIYIIFFVVVVRLHLVIAIHLKERKNEEKWIIFEMSWNVMIENEFSSFKEYI
jgi:heme/copper-type cytochrome/quinol oxidase subunit 4